MKRTAFFDLEKTLFFIENGCTQRFDIKKHFVRRAGSLEIRSKTRLYAFCGVINNVSARPLLGLETAA